MGGPARQEALGQPAPAQSSLGSMWALVLLWPLVMGFNLEDDSQSPLTYDEMGSTGGGNGACPWALSGGWREA